MNTPCQVAWLWAIAGGGMMLLLAGLLIWAAVTGQFRDAGRAAGLPLEGDHRYGPLPPRRGAGEDGAEASAEAGAAPALRGSESPPEGRP